MKCPKCQHENREGATYCEECGTKLELVCPNCGQKVRPQAKFCDECGTKLVETEPKPQSAKVPKLEDMKDTLYIPEPLRQRMDKAEQEIEGENRLVTAVFADISGFTPMSQQLSSENVIGKVNQCFKVITNAIYRYEGSVNRFIGDCVLAFFGAPITHENDPERAVLAALDMREAVSELKLNISVGINTGMMYFGPIGTHRHQEISAYGPEINLAKRFQEAAKPGEILIGKGTYKSTKRAFDFQTVSGLSLKGIDEPVTAYKAVRVKEHPEKLRGIEGLKVRMIGREKEFLELNDAAKQWVSGQGQIVTIIGEAGIGKSRLVAELKTYLERQEVEHAASLSECKDGKVEHAASLLGTEEQKPEIRNSDSEFLWLEGRCISIGQPVSYWPFIDMFRTLFNLKEDDTEREVAQKVKDGIDRLFPQRAEDILPFLGHLMSIKFGDELDEKIQQFSTEQIRHQTMMRLRDVFVTLAKKEPLILVLEDLHWSDHLSLDLLSLLMDELVTSQIMLICVYRPERNHRCWQLSTMAQRKCFERYTEIQIQKLTQHQCRQLVRNLLAIDNLPDSVREMVLRKSEGNPFFIEEVIRSLINRDLVYRDGDRWKAREEISDIDVPDTIQSVIMSRVDRLETESKYVLQCASVIGRLFRYRLLGHLVRHENKLDEYLDEFEQKDLVYEERTVPEVEYAFKHALTQEATYQGILGQRRRKFHHQVAVGIERLYQERIEDFYEELAHHWKQSGNKEKTLEYLVKAGKKAAGQYANEVAIDYYTKAIGLAEEMDVSDDQLAELYEARGKIYNVITFYEECIADMMDAVGLYSQPTKRARMYQEISDTYQFFIVDVEEAVRYARKAIEEIDPADKSRETASTYDGVASTFIYSIDLEEGKRLLEKAIAISEEMGYKDLLASHYTMLKWMYFFYPRSEEFAQKRQLAREKALSYLPYLKESNLSGYATACGLLGGGGSREERMRLDYDERIYFGHEALESGTKCGNGWIVVIAAGALGETYRDQGEIQKTIEVYEQGWRLGVRVRFISWNYMTKFAKELMKLYVSRQEQSKLLDMMLQMVDSTMVLHGKSEVHPKVRRRWNDTVEEMYEELHTIDLAAYHELEHSLVSRLNETDTDGEKFFCHGQLMLLALLDSRWENVETYVQKLLKLRPNAGNFAQRISKKVEYATELMGVEPKEHHKVALNLMKSVDQFKHLQEALGIIEEVLPDDEIAQVIDWDWLGQLVLLQLQGTGDVHIQAYGSSALRSWSTAVNMYKRYGHRDKLQKLVERVWKKIPDKMHKAGITQLLLEPIELDEPGLPEFNDQFSQDPVANGWEWVNPAEDCVYRLVKTGIEIDVPPRHDIFPRSNYDGPRILREIEGDFILEAKISYGSEGKMSGGLLVWMGKDNFIRLEMPSSTLWKGTVYYGATVAGKSIHPGVHPFEAEKAWLRLERKGNRFTGYVSSDGENWYSCGWADIPMEGPIKVGIHALCPLSPATSTRFEYFKLYRPKT